MKFKIFFFSLIVVMGLSYLISYGLTCKTSTYIKAEYDISAIGHNVNVFFGKSGGLPISLDDLVNEKYKVLKRLPNDPWDVKYQYNILNKDTFIIWSKGSVKNGNFIVSSIFNKNENGKFIPKIMHGESSI